MSELSAVGFLSGILSSCRHGGWVNAWPRLVVLTQYPRTCATTRARDYVRTHLGTVGYTFDDAVDELRAIAESEVSLWIEFDGSSYRNRCRVHIHLRRYVQRSSIFVITPCELVVAGTAKVLHNIGRFEIAIAEPRGIHGYRGRMRTCPLDEIAPRDFEGNSVTSFRH